MARGQAEWQHFFTLMGSALALREGTALVADTPTKQRELSAELRKAAEELHVENVLTTWNRALHELPAKNATNAAAFLLVLDPYTEEIQVSGYSRSEMQQASSDYLETEKSIGENSDSQAVLVSVDSVATLKAAYPNYFVDAEVFLEALREALA